MSSVIFRPLLHDPLGWKQSNSTYADTFTWKKYQSASKDKRISTYGQQYQRQLQKQQKLQPTNNRLPSVTNEEQTIQPIIFVKKNEENRGSTPMSNRSSSSKRSSFVSEKPPAFIIEYKQRPASINREATCGSRTSYRSQTIATAAEETSRPKTSADARRSPKEEKEKIINDSNNVDIKQRLGQTKVSSAPLPPISAVNAFAEPSESSVPHRQRQQSADQRQKSTDEGNVFDFSLPETPNELRAARHRLERNRYNPSVDNYPPRPRTCPVRTNENSKPLTPANLPQSEDQQLPPIQTKDDVWINDEENKTTENETSSSSSIIVQMVDCDGLPKEYAEALQTASIAQEEYYKNFKINNEERPLNPVYRLPSMSSDTKNESCIAYHNQQQSTPTTNNNSIRQNNFDTWIRNATDKERESAMKIIHEVLNQPIMGYDIPTKSKKPPVLSSVRTNSAARKLGHTRSPHQRIPCEICEKRLIKKHVWNLSRSDTLTCPHQAQEIKPPVIQVET